VLGLELLGEGAAPMKRFEPQRLSMKAETTTIAREGVRKSRNAEHEDKVRSRNYE
jgi:hypothetical protein